jgi:hypothetical protein
MGSSSTGTNASGGNTAAQSQTGPGSCAGCLPELTVSASRATAPAFFLGGSKVFLAPSGMNFQALRDLGRQFAAQGLNVTAFAAEIVKNPAINLQLLSKEQGLGYGFYQDAANFAVGVVSEGYFGGSYIGWVEMSGGGQWYALNNATNWSTAMPGYWQGWWNAGWSAASSGNYPVQVGTPLQMSYPLQ